MRTLRCWRANARWRHDVPPSGNPARGPYMSRADRTRSDLPGDWTDDLHPRRLHSAAGALAQRPDFLRGDQLRADRAVLPARLRVPGAVARALRTCRDRDLHVARG